MSRRATLSCLLREGDRPLPARLMTRAHRESDDTLSSLLKEVEQRLVAAGHEKFAPLLPELTLSQIQDLLRPPSEQAKKTRGEQEEAVKLKLSRIQKSILIQAYKRLSANKALTWQWMLGAQTRCRFIESEMATLSRTLRRLENRGLIVRYRDKKNNSFFRLTVLGAKIAKQLLLENAD